MPKAPHEFEVDLAKLVNENRIVVVAGSGVSISSTERKAPSWVGLIQQAADKCLALGASKEWHRVVGSQLSVAGDLDLLLSAAELVHTKLESFGKGEFARWLRETLENLQPTAPRLIKSIAALNAPMVTTNYDDLFEKVTGLNGISWLQEREVSRTLRNEARQIVHLHGHWNQPDSVVLGIRSYEAVRKGIHTQATLRAFGLTHSFLFIGCGDDGLSDPDFGNFLSWLRETETGAQNEHRHYRLIRESEADAVKPSGRVFPLVYGKKFEDLPRFLERVVSSRHRKVSPVPGTVAAPSKSTSSKRVRKSSTKRPAKRSPAVEAYVRRLAEQTSKLMLMGFGRSLQIELPISDAFVPLQATLTRSLEVKRTERALDVVGESAEDVEIADMFQHAKALGKRGVVLLGEPGAGKTTGARQLAWQLASGTRTPEECGLPGDITPVFLKFRALSRHALEHKSGLRTFLEEQTCCHVEKDGLGEPGKDLLSSSPLLWILDGLDEVIDPDARVRVSRWIQDAIKARPDDYFLVTCRFAGYFRDGVILGPPFVEFHVRPLSDTQVDEFVKRWYRAAYPLLRLSLALADERAQGLLDRLALPDYQAGRMPELRTNPQLLTLLCIVFHDKQQLPDNRAELYAECIMVFLQYWRQEVFESELGKQRPGFDAKAAQSVLAQMAWWMHSEQDRTSAPIRQLEHEVAKALQVLQPEAGLGYDGGAFIDRMKDETGILASDTEGRCGFLHLSFQEYLAADHAVSQRDAKSLAIRIREPWWREVGLLSLRQNKTFCEDFFRAMLEAGVAEDSPDIADRCLRESLYFSADPFIEILKAGKPVKRVAAVLRMLKGRFQQLPKSSSLLRSLVKHRSDAVRSLAFEISAQVEGAPKVAGAHMGLVIQSPAQIPMVRISAGKFQMGSATDLEYERPTRMVQISKDFLLGRYPVTNAQYGEYIKLAGKKVKKPEYWNSRRFNQPEQPVVGVSWYEAERFCEWAGCRLPTEAEWEYACRAGTTTAFSFGDDGSLLDQYGWYEVNSGKQTQPVGTKLANPWGLHDMHGNVWEWCQDWYGQYGKESVVDPTGPEKGEGRVLRGGSWYYVADYCRSSIRGSYRPDDRFNIIGFRVARTL